MNWSSPFPEDKKRAKITNTKQLEEDDLANYVPPKPQVFEPKDKYPLREAYESKPKENVYEQEYVYKSSDMEISEKLSYMIRLLEEQRDEKTGQVTEELILYVFLGIFTLFVLDTFVKTGKYSR
jgi:hypothetical protein